MSKVGTFGYLCEQLSRVPPVIKVDLTGKTVMVVGANTGLGFETCKHFSLMNPTRIILVCRDKARGEAAVARLSKETGYKAVELWLVDLSEFASVVSFADKFEKEGGPLDILVANAAILTSKYSSTADGWEKTIQVNCLSLFLLALRLLPKLLETAVENNTHSRLVFVTSGAHCWSGLENRLPENKVFQTVSSKEYDVSPVDRYYDTKLFNIFFVQALSERLGAKSPVIVDSVNPGLCRSELGRELTGLSAVLVWMSLKILARSSEEGGRELVYAALGGRDQDNEDQFRGAYISATRISEASYFAVGPKGRIVQDKLWSEIVDILAGVDPRVQYGIEKYLSQVSLPRRQEKSNTEPQCVCC